MYPPFKELLFSLTKTHLFLEAWFVSTIFKRSQARNGGTNKWG
jgi:hypothetical protein